MTPKTIARKALNSLLSPFDYELSRRGRSFTPRWTMQAALQRASEIGISPSTLIDVGAASGKWSQLARQIFPNSTALLIEPIEEHRIELDEFVLNWAGSAVEMAVAGSENAEVIFNVTNDPDGSGVYGSEGKGTPRIVKQFTVDEIVSRKCMPGPYLLKLDTHGYEIPIFNGARKTLEKTDLIVVEVYGFRPAPTAVRFWELCSWLQDHGFRMSDMTDLMGRQLDGMFWQADFLFLRDSNPVFQSDSYD